LEDGMWSQEAYYKKCKEKTLGDGEAKMRGRTRFKGSISNSRTRAEEEADSTLPPKSAPTSHALKRLKVKRQIKGKEGEVEEEQEDQHFRHLPFYESRGSTTSVEINRTHDRSI